MRKRFATIPLLVSACVTVWLWIVFAASAQSLPKLNAQPISNQVFGISWPYTNAGFALQESGGLRAVSNWQASVLTPAFNSSSAVFSVSAAATNATRFFRLEQPADLRGIYVYVGLETATNSPDAVPLMAALNQPGVDGMLLVGLWSSIETNLNRYNWNQVDRWMDYAAFLNKKIAFSLRAGDGIPDWLYLPPPNGAGATELTFTISPKDGKTTNCQPDKIAIPWEPAFLTNWNLMLSNLSAHLKQQDTYSNLTLLRLTGINRTSDELRLPAETPDTNLYTGTGLDCVSNAPAIWQTNGYTPSKLLSAWSNILTAFNTSFPDKSFCVAIIPYPPQVPFPPIDDSGNLITNNLPDQNRPLLQLAGQMLPGRFVVQFNFLMTSNAANLAVTAAAQNFGTLTAFQVNNWYGSNGPSGSACGGTVKSPTPCDDALYLEMMQQGIYPLGSANPLRSQYIEVWATNAVTFTNAIWQAHQELFMPP
jgi:hypothetical protein